MADALFKTERLSVRPLGVADVGVMHQVYGDPLAMRWVGDGKPLSRADCLKWVDVTARNYETRGYGMWAVVHRQSDRVIGFCGLVHPNRQVQVELKYALLQDCWGRGYGSEVVSKAVEFAHDVFGMTQIIATVAPENHVSCRVLGKAGFAFRETRKDESGQLEKLYVWSSPEADAVSEQSE